MTVQKSFRDVSKIVLFVFFLLWISFFGASSSYALNNPQQYYDWGPYYPRVNPRVLGVSVSADAPQSSPSGTVDGAKDVTQFHGYFLGFGSNFSPNSPFYFVKRLQENLILGLTFDPTKRQDIRLQMAGERLGEIESLVRSNQTKNLSSVSRDYQKTLNTVTAGLDEVQNSSSQKDESLKQFEEESAKHTLVLEEVAARAGGESQNSLDGAIAASSKVSDTVADLSGRAALPVEVLDRIQALKAQGLLSPEEAQKLVSLTSRVQARGELQKFVNEGIFPEADIAKLNQLAKEKFGQSFNQMVELKKFQELKKLEEEKPDDEILKKVQDLAKNYKSGDFVPPDLRRYWVPMVRLEELQNTIRPDFINENSIRNNQNEYKKYQEVVERLKPRPEDVAQIEKIISQNPNAASDPFYERVRRFAEKFGTTEGGTQVPGVPTAAKSCPTNSHWANVPYMPEGGYCVPNITYVPYQPQATDTESKSATASESVCPSKYHRNYPNGPCVPDAYFGSPVNYPTYTPGDYPSPVYSPASCPVGYVWTGSSCMSSNFVAQSQSSPGNGQPRADMGDCRTPGECYDWCKANAGKCPGFNPNSGRPGDTNRSMTPSRESQEAACRSGGGVCVSWVNGACGCERPGDGAGSGNANACPNGQWWDRGTFTCRTSCPSGTSWNGNSCMKDSSSDGSGNAGYPSCPQGQYQGPSGTCVSSSNDSGSPSRDSQERACRSGGGVCVSWVNGACGCERSGQSSGTGGSGGGNYYGGGSTTTPPSGYGSCSSGQYWNGSSCVSNTYTPPPSSESPEQACLRGTNCSWNGSSCNCTPSSPTSSPSPTPSPEPSPAPPPSDSGGAGSSCSSGQYWNGSSCVTGQY